MEERERNETKQKEETKERFNKRMCAYAKRILMGANSILRSKLCAYFNHFHRITVTRDREKYNFIHKFECVMCVELHLAYANFVAHTFTDLY